LALLKDTKLTETVDLQFRAEFFNVFNHTQFQNANGNISSSASFGSCRVPPIPHRATLAEVELLNPAEITALLIGGLFPAPKVFLG